MRERSMERIFDELLTHPATHASVLELRTLVDDARLTDEMARRARNTRKDLADAQSDLRSVHYEIGVNSKRADALLAEIADREARLAFLNSGLPLRCHLGTRIIDL